MEESKDGESDKDGDGDKVNQGRMTALAKNFPIMTGRSDKHEKVTVLAVNEATNSRQAPKEVVNNESLKERLEGLFKSFVTNVESIMNENEAKKVKVHDEFSQKNIIHKDNLQKLSEHQTELEEKGEGFTADEVSFTDIFTEGFEKIKKQTQDKLDKVTTEIMRTEVETEKFIEKTKNDFGNHLKVLEGKVVI